MKRAVNIRLEESVIYTLNQLSEELHSTKTEVIEKAIEFFSKQNHLKQNQILQFAGKLKNSDIIFLCFRVFYLTIRDSQTDCKNSCCFVNMRRILFSGGAVVTKIP